MRYWRLVLANLFRKKIRTTLTIGSFAVALFLFGLLLVVHNAFYSQIDMAGVDRLVVLNKVSIIQPLPLAYRNRLLRVPGVKEVSYANWFNGVYQDERNFFPQFAVDSDTYRSMFPEFVVTDEEWKAFLADKQACIVGKSLAEKFGWKIGDRIPIRGTIFAGNWEFNLRGIYTGKRKEDDTSQFWFRWDYLEERRQWGKGQVGWYSARLSNVDDAVTVSRAIDGVFANSPWETKTETEKAFNQGWVKQMGNIEMLILSIGTVVFFTLLLVTGNTMATAVRERVRELAVLKAIGFTDRFMLGLVLAESLLVAVLGGVVGLVLAKLFTMRGDPLHGLLPVFYLPPSGMAFGLALAVAVGLVAGVMPAVGAMRLRVVDALRRI